MYGFLGSVRDYLFKPAEGDLFQINGQLSPNEFYRAGDHLTKVCAGWQWKPSLIPNYTSPCMKDKDKQFLMLEKVVCRRRLSTMMPQVVEKYVESEQGGDGITMLCSPEVEYEEKKEDIRYYTMYIVYDEGYHVPRMYFTATDYDLQPLPPQAIYQDIHKDYLHKTITVEKFPFMDVSMPTVHPCKHAEVLKTMSDSMVEGKQKVQSYFALLIFVKFITNVIPTVEFDMTGDLIFQ